MSFCFRGSCAITSTGFSAQDARANAEQMTISIYIVCGILGFLVAWGFIPLILEFSRRMARLQRDKCFHHGNAAPISRLGGVAIAAAFVVCVFSAARASGESIPLGTMNVLLGSLAMFALGLLDDLNPIGARLKLVGQIVISGFVAWGGSTLECMTNPLSGTSVEVNFFAGWAVSVLWLVALTNLINIIDGIDGLAGGISLMLMVLLAFSTAGGSEFLVMLTLGMIGALVGFLYFNFPPARIYMGDGGAYFLGFLIGGLTLVTSQKGTVAAALVAPVFALALPIIDVALAIVRRALKGLPVFRADRRHIHHRLVESGFSHRRTLLTLYVVSLLFLLMAFGVFWSQGRLVPLFLGLSFLVVIYIVHSFGLVSSKYSLQSFWRELHSMRRESRYTMLLAQWLELEAERCQTPEELWENFVFIAAKLDLAEVKLHMRDGLLAWRDPRLSDAVELVGKRHDFHGSTILGLEMYAQPNKDLPKVFEMKCELAAEAWFKAASRWRTAHNAEFHLSPNGNRLVAVRPALL